MEQDFLNVLLVTLSRDGFNDATEEQITKVGVRVTRAGVEIQPLRFHVIDHPLRRRGQRFAERFGNLEIAKHRIKRCLSIPPAAMLQELPDGYVVHPGIYGPREVENGSDALIQFDTPRVDQL